MNATLGPFALAELEAAADSGVAASVERALAHYAQRAGSSDPPPPIPAFLEGVGGAAAERATAHAVMVYLADLERPGTEVLDASPRS